MHRRYAAAGLTRRLASADMAALEAAAGLPASRRGGGRFAAGAAAAASPDDWAAFKCALHHLPCLHGRLCFCPAAAFWVGTQGRCTITRADTCHRDPKSPLARHTRAASTPLGFRV